MIFSPPHEENQPFLTALARVKGKEAFSFIHIKENLHSCRHRGELFITAALSSFRTFTGPKHELKVVSVTLLEIAMGFSQSI